MKKKIEELIMEELSKRNPKLEEENQSYYYGIVNLVLASINEQYDFRNLDKDDEADINDIREVVVMELEGFHKSLE